MHVGDVRGFLWFVIYVPVLVGFCILLEHLFPGLLLIFPPLWISSLLLDLYTTWLFYRVDPGGFWVNERNVVYASLVLRFGFGVGCLLHLILVEVSFLLVSSFLLIPLLYSFLAGRMPTLFFSSLAAMALLSSAHLQAFLVNVRFGGCSTEDSI